MALLMASILLSVGMGISNIAFKEIKLSSIGNESGKAFYMADTGAECALYWDSKGQTITGKYIFATSTLPGTYVTAGSGIKCFNGLDISTLWSIDPGADATHATTTFVLSDTDPTKPCVVIAVGKRVIAGNTLTNIDSRGRSSCDDNPRRVERGLKVSY